MVSTCSFEKMFPGIDPIVMELLPWAKYKPKMFWDSDLLKMSKRLGVYQRAVNECNPDAGPAMENFKKNCMEEAEWIMDVLLSTCLSLLLLNYRTHSGTLYDGL